MNTTFRERLKRLFLGHSVVLEGIVDVVDLPDEKKVINPITGEPETYFRLRNSWGRNRPSSPKALLDLRKDSNFGPDYQRTGHFILSKTELLSGKHLTPTAFVDVMSYDEGDNSWRDSLRRRGDSLRRIGDLVTMVFPALLVALTVEQVAAMTILGPLGQVHELYKYLVGLTMLVRALALGRALAYPPVVGYDKVFLLMLEIRSEVNYVRAMGRHAGARDYRSMERIIDVAAPFGEAAALSMTEQQENAALSVDAWAWNKLQIVPWTENARQRAGILGRLREMIVALVPRVCKRRLPSSTHNAGNDRGETHGSGSPVCKRRRTNL